MKLSRKLIAQRLLPAKTVWKLQVIRLLATQAQPQTHHCNLCGFRGYFFAFGNPVRYHARCPQCGSMERHRLIGLLADNSPELFAGRVLHFAPESAIKTLLQSRATTYITADQRPLADLQLNIEDIDLPDSSFDLVVCSHVLEHVDDHKALRELHRILTPNGTALIMTPVIEGWAATYENSDITSHEDRLVHFGQHDHVRFYGADIRSRIRAAEFNLDEFTATEPSVHKHGLVRGEKVFIARCS